MYLLSFATFM